ncbi:MAG: hypothetical protein IJW25_01950 [Clostridia bacterium]|nr:hypothetical protein [Clostridia bacterium]
MVLVNFGEEFVSLFANMHAVVAILLCAGVVLCIIEAIVPGFGVFGILGTLLEVAGIVVHAIISGSALQVLFLIIIIMLVLGLLVFLFLHSAKKGLLAKSALVENKPTIPVDYALKTAAKLLPLVGKEGLTLTDCRPVGKIKLGDNTYEAICTGALISKGEAIKVVAIEDSRIVIDKITY